MSTPYRPRTAEYAILLTYIDGGVRVRATPASRLAELSPDQATSAGIPSQLTVHEPSKGFAADTHTHENGAADILELDIAHSELNAVLGGEKAHEDQRIRSFLQLLIGQLCIYVNQNGEYKLVFAGANNQNGTSVAFQSARALPSDNDYSSDEFDDPALAAEMIPPAVAAAAVSEPPPPRSPTKRTGSTSNATMPLNATPVASRQATTTTATSTPASHPTPSTTPNPNLSALMDELNSLRRENGELRLRNTRLQELVDHKSAQEAGHLTEVATLRTKLAQAKEKLCEYEEQLYLLQPNIQQLVDQGISPGRLRSGPASPSAGGPSSDRLGSSVFGSNSSIGPDGVDRSTLIVSLQSQLSQSVVHISSLSTALVSLQTSYHTLLQTFHTEFGTIGQTLRMSVEIARQQNQLVGDLGDESRSWLSKEQETWTPFSPKTAKQQQAELEANLKLENDLKDINDTLLPPIMAPSPTAALSSSSSSDSSSLPSLDRLMSISHTLEQRSLRLSQGFHQRTNLIHASIMTLKHTSLEIKRELETMRADERRQQKGGQQKPSPSPSPSPASSSSTYSTGLPILTNSLGLKGPQIDVLKKYLFERDQELSHVRGELVQQQLQHLQVEQQRLQQRSRNGGVGEGHKADTSHVDSMIQQLSSQLKAQLDQLHHLTSERNTLIDQLRTQQVGYEQEKSRWQDEMAKLQVHLTSMDRQIRNGGTPTNGNSHVEENDPASSSASAASLRHELATLRKLHSDNSSNILSIHGELNAKNLDLVRLQTENLHLLKDNAKMESIIHQAKEQTMVLSGKLSHFESIIIPGLAAENTSLKDEVDTLSQELKDLRQRLEKDARSHTSHEREYDQLRHELESTARRCQTSEQSRTTLDTSLTALRTQHASVQARLVDVELENQTLASRLSHHAQRLKGDETTIKQLQQEKREVTQQLEALRKENEILSSHVNTTKGNLLQLQQQHEELQRMHKNLLDSRNNNTTGATHNGVAGNHLAQSFGSSFGSLNLSSSSPAAAAALPSTTPSVDPSDIAGIIRENYSLKMALHQQQGTIDITQLHSNSSPTKSLHGGPSKLGQSFQGGRSSSSSTILGSPIAGGAPTVGDVGIDSTLAVRLQADQDAALASYELLRNQVSLHSNRLIEKEQDFEELTLKLRSNETQLAHAEMNISNLQQTISKQQQQNEDSIQTIQSLQHQLRQAQTNLTHKSTSIGSVEHELTILLDEKHTLQVQLNDLKKDLHTKSLQVSDGLDLIANLESELAGLKLVLLPYQKNHLDIGCESIRLRQEVELRAASETIRNLERQLKLKDSNLSDLTEEFEHMKIDKKEWTQQVPILKKEKQELIQVVDTVREQVNDLSNMIDRAKKERKNIVAATTQTQPTATSSALMSPTKSSSSSAAKDGSLTSPFRLSGPSSSSSTVGAGASATVDDESYSPLTPSASSQPISTRVSDLLNDLAPILSSYLDLTRFRQETEVLTSNLTKTLRDKEDQWHIERNELSRRLKSAQSTIATLESDGTRAATGVSELTEELSEIRSRERTTQHTLQQHEDRIEHLIIDKKELQQNVDALLTLQKHWESERDMMLETHEGVSKQKEKLSRQVEQVLKERETTTREYETRLEQLKKEQQRLLQLEREYRSTQSSLEKDLSQVRDTHDELKRQYDDTNHRFEQLQHEFDQLRHDHDEKLKDYEQLRLELNQRKIEMKLFETECHDLKKLRDTQVRSYEKLRGREDELIRRCSELEEQVSNLTRSNEKLRSREEEVQYRCKDFEQQIQNLHRDAKDPLERLQETHARTQEDLAAWQEKFSELSRALSDMTLEKDEVNKSYQKLKDQHKEALIRLKSDWDDERKETNDTLRTLRSQLKSSSEDVVQLQDDKKEFEKSLTSSNKNLNLTKIELQRLQERFTTLEEELREVMNERLNLSNNLTNLQTSSDKCQTQLSHTQTLLEQEKDRTRKLTKEVDKLQRDLTQAQRDATRESEVAHRTLEKEFDRLQATLTSSERETKRLERQLDQVLNDKKEIEVREKSSLKTIDQLERDLVGKNETCERFERQRLEDTKSLNEKLYLSETQLRKLQDTLFTTDTKYKESETSLQTLQRTFQDSERRLHEYELERSSLQRTLNEQERKVRDYENELKVLQRNVHDSERRLHESNLMLETCQREKIPRFEATIIELNQTLYERMNEKDMLKKKWNESEYVANEMRSKLEYDLNHMKKEFMNVQLRLTSESEMVVQLRTTQHQLEREHGLKLTQLQTELTQRENDVIQLQQSNQKLVSEKDTSNERCTKFERKLKELSHEHDLLTKTHAKDVVTISNFEVQLQRCSEREHECKTLHLGEWEGLLQRTQKDLREHFELVTMLRIQLSNETSEKRTQLEELKKIMDDTIMKKDHLQSEELNKLKHQQHEDLKKMDQAYGQLKKEYTQLSTDHATTITHHIDRQRSLQIELESRMNDLERIRSMLGIEWEELLNISQNGAIALRERARSLFSNDATMSIEQLQALVKQQNLHIQDGKNENQELNGIIERLKGELQAYKNQKITEHSTMDKLLSANKRLQQFIDSLPIDLRASVSASSSLIPVGAGINTSAITYAPSAIGTPMPPSIYQPSQINSPYVSPIKEPTQRGTAATAMTTAAATNMQPANTPYAPIRYGNGIDFNATSTFANVNHTTNSSAGLPASV